MYTIMSTCTPTSIGRPCQVPEAILEIASKPGRLIKNKDGVWCAPSNWTTGGRLVRTIHSKIAPSMIVRVVAVLGGAVIHWGSDVRDVRDVLGSCCLGCLGVGLDFPCQ